MTMMMMMLFTVRLAATITIAIVHCWGIDYIFWILTMPVSMSSMTFGRLSMLTVMSMLVVMAHGQITERVCRNVDQRMSIGELDSLASVRLRLTPDFERTGSQVQLVHVIVPVFGAISMTLLLGQHDSLVDQPVRLLVTVDVESRAIVGLMNRVAGERVGPTYRIHFLAGVEAFENGNGWLGPSRAHVVVQHVLGAVHALSIKQCVHCCGRIVQIVGLFRVEVGVFVCTVLFGLV